MNKQTTLFLFLAAASLFLAGCATGRSGDNPFRERAQAEDIKVTITNLAFSDVTVWGVANGARRRLGTVTGTRETAFFLPVAYPSEVYLEIDLVAGPRCRTEAMLIGPGDHVELTIRAENPGMICGGR